MGMKRNRRKKFPVLVIVLAAVLLLSVGMGTTWALASLKTAKVENSFAPAQVSIVVNETFSNGIKENVSVTNTGSKNDPAVYVRVKLLTYWYEQDSDHIAAKSAWTPSFTTGADWIKIGDYYYYQKPVKATESTSNLISSITLIEEDGARQVLEVVAEAIQSNPATAAIESWNIAVDANGHIKESN